MTNLITSYGRNKTAQQIREQIFNAPSNANIMITKFDHNMMDDVFKQGAFKQDIYKHLVCYDVEQPTDIDYYYKDCQKNHIACICYVKSCSSVAIVHNLDLSTNAIAITSAGLADRNAVDEAGLTVMLHGYTPKFFNDIGVNTLNKTIDALPEINQCKAIISVQGFEGALPVVLAGLTKLPIIAVPTNTGYGVASKGYTALNTALSSCTSGITVVNIGNGFGAGEFAVRILNLLGE